MEAGNRSESSARPLHLLSVVLERGFLRTWVADLVAPPGSDCLLKVVLKNDICGCMEVSRSSPESRKGRFGFKSLWPTPFF